MKNKNLRALFHCLLFAFAMLVLGAYEIAGVSAALVAVLLAGVSLEPLFALLSVALYLVAGIWLPVYPGSAGSAFGTATLLGANGGYLFALLLCALAVSALQKAMRGHTVLSVLIGLCIAFLLYFGVGILWTVLKTDVLVRDMFNRTLAKRSILFAADALLTLLASPQFRRMH